MPMKPPCESEGGEPTPPEKAFGSCEVPVPGLQTDTGGGWKAYQGDLGENMVKELWQNHLQQPGKSAILQPGDGHALAEEAQTDCLAYQNEGEIQTVLWDCKLWAIGISMPACALSWRLRGQSCSTKQANQALVPTAARNYNNCPGQGLATQWFVCKFHLHEKAMIGHCPEAMVAEKYCNQPKMRRHTQKDEGQTCTCSL